MVGPPTLAEAEVTADGVPVDVGGSPWSQDDELKDATRASHYYFYPGSAFVPLYPSTTKVYESYGCVSLAAGGGDYLAHYVFIPNAFTVTHVRLYYYDASSSSVIVWLKEVDGLGNSTYLTDATSSGTEGYGTELATAISYTVSNGLRALMLEVALADHSSDLRFCGARILANDN